jgi:hypothetical protein
LAFSIPLALFSFAFFFPVSKRGGRGEGTELFSLKLNDETVRSCVRDALRGTALGLVRGAKSLFEATSFVMAAAGGIARVGASSIEDIQAISKS